MCTLRSRSGGASLAACLLVVATTGCGAPDLEARLARYESAVARALGERPADPAPPDAARIRLPARRHRAVAVAAKRIGVLHFLSLQGCRLGVLAGERTGPLGRQLEASRRLIYELDVVASARDCLVPGMDPERRDALEAIVAVKRRQLPIHLWNAVWAGPEIETYLRLAPPSSPASGGDGGAADALARLAALLEGGGPAEAPGEAGPGPGVGEAVERLLHRLEEAAPLGPILVDLDAARGVLARVSGRLGAFSATTRCGPPEARLARAFRDTWLAFVQSAVTRRHARLRDELPLLAALHRTTRAGLARAGETPAPELEAWVTRTVDVGAADGLWRGWEAALDDHVRAWRPILVACAVLPPGP